MVNVRMSAIKFDIQKLDSVINFSRWHIRMNAIMTKSGLKKTILGKEKKKSRIAVQREEEEKKRYDIPR